MATATFKTVNELITTGKSVAPSQLLAKLVLALENTNETFFTRYFLFLTELEKVAIDKKYSKLLFTATTERYKFTLYLLETGEKYMVVVTPTDLE